MWYRLVVPCLVLALALGPLGCVRSQVAGFGWGRSGKSPYRSVSPATLSDHIRTTIEAFRPAQKLYEELYCARGEAENRIKEQQLELVCRSDLDATA